MRFIKTTATIVVSLFMTNNSFAENNFTDQMSANLQSINKDNELNHLYQEGLILPNQPLQMSDEVRAKIRDQVQSEVRNYTSQGVRLKSYERESINAMLFNYGLQVLEDNSVVVLDLYIPEKANATQMLSPTVPMPDNAVIITKDNVEALNKSLKKQIQKHNQNNDISISGFENELEFE